MSVEFGDKPTPPESDPTRNRPVLFFWVVVVPLLLFLVYALFFATR